MIDLDTVKFLDLLPNRITDEYMEALAYAIDPEMQEITQAINEAFIMTQIDKLPEPVVDILAWQLHVDFYEPLGLDLTRKRELVKSSLIWHRYKGTKYVLEDMIRVLFFDNFNIEEWFEYGGEPYFFRLISHDVLTDPRQYHDLIRAIYQLKNERSWLEGLTFHLETKSTIHMGITNRITEFIEIDGFAPQSYVNDVSVNLGLLGKQTTHIEIGGTFSNTEEISPVYTRIGIIGKYTERVEIDVSNNPQVYVVNTKLQTTGKYTTKINI